MVIPAFVLLLAATILGAPIFVTLGGAALILLWGDAIPIEMMPIRHYQQVTNASLPAIPMFTLAGYLSGGGRRGQEACARVPDAGGPFPRRAGDRDGSGLRFFHEFHGRFRSHDPRVGRLADAGPPGRALFGTECSRPAHRFRIHRPAVSALPAGDPLRDHRQHRYQSDVPGRPPARDSDGDCRQHLGNFAKP